MTSPDTHENTFWLVREMDGELTIAEREFDLGTGNVTWFILGNALAYWSDEDFGKDYALVRELDLGRLAKDQNKPRI